MHQPNHRFCYTMACLDGMLNVFTDPDPGFKDPDLATNKKNLSITWGAHLIKHIIFNQYLDYIEV